MGEMDLERVRWCPDTRVCVREIGIVRALEGVQRKEGVIEWESVSLSCPVGRLLMGSSHSMECEVFFSMEVKAAISWSCYVFNSMEFHGIAGLTFRKCTPADSMEKFQTIAGLILGGVLWFIFLSQVSQVPRIIINFVAGAQQN